jgi:hypothetical protein
MATREDNAMLYMIIEEFKEGPEPVYARFREKGRMTPDGLQYVNSWITSDMQRCYQIMETPNPVLLDQWMAKWDDIITFEIIPVVASSEAASHVAKHPSL